MALIIEDGSIVTGANSFTTDAEFVAYAALRGLVIPALEADRNVLQILAVDYLAGKELNMKGARVNAIQDLMYPRKGVAVNNFAVLSTSIPIQLKYAQMELAAQANESELLKTGTVQNLASIEIDGVYAESYFSGGAWEYVRTERADVYLNPLLVNNGSSNLMVRV